jgi:hypothetical protein
MCYAVYIGTDQPLATSEWREKDCLCYLTELAEKDHPARQHFSKPYVYYAGSHLGCSCGFFHNSMVFTDDPAMMTEYEKTQNSTRALIALLEQALQQASTVEGFVTWEGNQALAPVRRLTLAPSALLSRLEPYSADTDPEVRIAISDVAEQDFVVFQTKGQS